MYVTRHTASALALPFPLLLSLLTLYLDQRQLARAVLPLCLTRVQPHSEKKANKGTLPHSCTPHHTPTHTVRRQEFSWRSCSHPLASLLTPLSFCCCCCCCPPQISPRPPNPLRPATARPSASNPADTEHTASATAQRHPTLLRRTRTSHRYSSIAPAQPYSHVESAGSEHRPGTRGRDCAHPAEHPAAGNPRRHEVRQKCLSCFSARGIGPVSDVPVPPLSLLASCASWPLAHLPGTPNRTIGRLRLTNLPLPGSHPLVNALSISCCVS